MNKEDVFNGYGVPIELKDEKAFLVVVETLSRMGIASKKNKSLFQSCHILHKRGKYAILHFKELFLLDGKEADITTDDYARRNSITKLLEEWGLLTILPGRLTEVSPYSTLNQIKIISHKEKNEWNLVPKYTIGNSSKKK